MEDPYLEDTISKHMPPLHDLIHVKAASAPQTSTCPAASCQTVAQAFHGNCTIGVGAPLSVCQLNGHT